MAFLCFPIADESGVGTADQIVTLQLDDLHSDFHIST